MKIISQVLLSVLLAGISNFTYAAVELNEQQINAIFTNLTIKPRDAWISTGNIAATHYQVKTATGQAIVTSEKVKYDGIRFQWDIDLIDHEELEGDYEENIDFEWNSSRTFVWDGTTYTMHFKSGKNALVTDSSVGIPVTVKGPLRAGVVPWGHGFYTLQNLLLSVSSAEIDQQGHLLLSITCEQEGYSVFLELDPTKDYAVVLRTIDIEGKSRIITRYSDYMKIADLWIPSTIILERYIYTEETEKLASYDHWDITSVDPKPCLQDQFKADYDDDTYIEYRTSANRIFSYRHKIGRNTESILKQRLNLVSQNNMYNHNCATAAIKHVASQFDMKLPADDIENLVTGAKKETSLYKLRQFAQQQGLHCQAVQGAIDSFVNLQNCQVILHLSQANHYVVLDHVDDEDVWLVDLDTDKFYYGMKRSQLAVEWSEQTALIISNTPIDIPAGCTAIADSRLYEIKGSSSGFGTYSCTDLIQEYDIQFCSPMMMGLCGGDYILWYNRFACELDDDGGYCSGDKLVGHIYTPCIEDFEDPGTCTVTGTWYSQYLHACQ